MPSRALDRLEVLRRQGEPIAPVNFDETKIHITEASKADQDTYRIAPEIIRRMEQPAPDQTLGPRNVTVSAPEVLRAVEAAEAPEVPPTVALEAVTDYPDQAWPLIEERIEKKYSNPDPAREIAYLAPLTERISRQKMLQHMAEAKSYQKSNDLLQSLSSEFVNFPDKKSYELSPDILDKIRTLNESKELKESKIVLKVGENNTLTKEQLSEMKNLIGRIETQNKTKFQSVFVPIQTIIQEDAALMKMFQKIVEENSNSIRRFLEKIGK
jgi:hypothetical protein